MSDSAVETRAGCKGRRRHSGSIRDAPVCDHHQTTGETETVPGAGDSAFVGQMLRDLLEPSVGCRREQRGEIMQIHALRGQRSL